VLNKLEKLEFLSIHSLLKIVLFNFDKLLVKARAVKVSSKSAGIL